MALLTPDLNKSAGLAKILNSCSDESGREFVSMVLLII
jgi:hypothetical protein